MVATVRYSANLLQRQNCTVVKTEVQHTKRKLSADVSDGLCSDCCLHVCIQTSKRQHEALLHACKRPHANMKLKSCIANG